VLIMCCIANYLVSFARSSVSDVDAWSGSGFNLASVNVSSQVVTVHKSKFILSSISNWGLWIPLLPIGLPQVCKKT